MIIWEIISSKWALYWLLILIGLNICDLYVWLFLINEWSWMNSISNHEELKMSTDNQWEGLEINNITCCILCCYVFVCVVIIHVLSKNIPPSDCCSEKFIWLSCWVNNVALTMNWKVCCNIWPWKESLEFYWFFLCTSMYECQSTLFKGIGVMEPLELLSIFVSGEHLVRE